MIIRKATTDDIALIQQVARQTYPPTYRGIEPEEMIAYMMEQMYATPAIQKQMAEGHDFYLAMDDGQPMGYVSLRREDAATCFMEKLYVLPSAHGKSIGKRLFQAAVAYAADRYGLPCHLQLHVNRYNEAVGFYRRQGMQIIGEGDPDVGHGFQMHYYVMDLLVTTEPQQV